MALWTPSNGSADFTTSGAAWKAGYRADQSGEITQSGGLVSQWNDWSGNGFHLGSSGTNRPGYGATAFPGSLPGLTFSQATQQGLNLVGLGVSVSTLVSAFAVALLNSSPGGIYNRLVSLSRSSDIDDFSDAGSYVPLLRYNNTNAVEAYAGGDTSSAAIPSNAGFVAAQIQAATTLQPFADGTGGSTFTKTPNYAWDNLGVGQRATGANTDCWDGVISEVLIVTGTVTPTLRQLIEGYLAWKWGTQASLPSGHPYLSAAPTIGASYTLTAAQGSISLTGQAVTLRAARKLTAATGSFALTGQSAALRLGRRLTAAAGSFNLTGVSANFKRTYALTASPGSFVLGGVNSGLRVDRKLVASTGTFALTGQDAILRYGAGSILTAATGAFNLTGQDAILRYGRKLGAAPGAFTLAGQSASLRRGYNVVATPGSFTLAGQSATLRSGRNLVAATGSFSVTGQDADLVYVPAGTGYTLAAATGSFVLTGQAATLRLGRRLAAEAGSFAFAGQSAILSRGRRIAAAQGSLNLTGLDAVLRSERRLAAVKGAFILTGQSATLRYDAGLTDQLRGISVTVSVGGANTVIAIPAATTTVTTAGLDTEIAG